MRHIARNRNRLKWVAAAILLGALAPSAAAQNVLAQWTFPSGFNTTTPAPSSGTGSAALLGTTATEAGGVLSSDPGAWNTTTYPAQGTGSGTRGVRFNTSSASASDLVVRFDIRYSNTSSRFVQLQYTTDGTAFTGAGLPNNGVFENTNGGDVFYTNRTFDLSGISGVNDNPSFGVRMVTVFDPATGTSYTPSNPGSSYGTTGTVRYDNVTVTSAHRWIGGTGTDIATAANYAGGASAPTAASTLLFAGTSNLTVTAAAAQSAAQVVFGAGAGNYTLSGSPLTLSAGVVNNSTGTQTIGNALDLSSFPQTIYANAAGGNLVLSGNVTISNQALLSTNLNGNLNVDGPGDVTVNGALSSATGANLDLGIRKSGTGTLFLNNAGNTLAAYAGGNLVAGGRLAGTGTAPGNWSMASGTTVQGGNGTAVGGTLTVGGNLTLTNTSTIRTVAGNGGTPTDTTTAGASLVDVDGNLNRSGAADTIRIELVNDGTLVTDGSTLYTRRVLTYTGLGTNLTEGTFTAGGPFEVTGLPVAAGWQVIVGSGNVDVRFTPVPEPWAVLGLAAAGLGLAGLVRRARRTARA